MLGREAEWTSHERRRPYAESDAAITAAQAVAQAHHPKRRKQPEKQPESTPPREMTGHLLSGRGVRAPVPLRLVHGPIRRSHQGASISMATMVDGDANTHTDSKSFALDLKGLIDFSS